MERLYRTIPWNIFYTLYRKQNLTLITNGNNELLQALQIKRCSSHDVSTYYCQLLKVKNKSYANEMRAGVEPLTVTTTN